MIEQEHAREMPDTLELIKDVVRMADDGVARRNELSSEEVVHILTQISRTGQPALRYSIAKQRR
jgi:hypothetical protein